MRVDPYIEVLLRKWGKLPESVYIGYPKQSPCFREYRPKGYRQDLTDLDREEVDRLSEWMSINLSPLHISVLKIRYRKWIRYKRKAARLLGISEKRYREYFNDCIKAIENRFLEKVA